MQTPISTDAPGTSAAIGPGELRGWCALAIIALALAGLFALLLALSRTPGLQDFLPWPDDFFRKGLVAHVALSFVIWILAVMGGLMRLSAPAGADGADGAAGRAAGKAALALAAIGTILILIPTFTNNGEPTLNNYIPVIIDPIYYTGLLVFAAGILLAVARALIEAVGNFRGLDELALITRTAGLIFLIALAVFALAYGDLGDAQPSENYNERLIWGGGHMLQFVNLALLLAVWGSLGESSLGRKIVGPVEYRWISALILISALPGLFVAVFLDANDDTYIDAFTGLQFLLAPSFLLFAGLAWKGSRRTADGPWPWRDPGFLCLVLSASLFAIGAVMGLFVDGADTRTPAHYHGVIGGINLAFMGLFFTRFLPRLGRAAGPGGLVRAQIFLYAAGQSLFVIGMFWAGSLGAARKTTAAAEDITTLAETAARVLTGIGGVIAVIGGILFIWTTARALTGRREASYS